MRTPPPPAGRIFIDLHDLPLEGKEFSGEIPGEIFELGPDGPACVSPLRYQLHVEIAGEFLIATGEVTADFQMDCVRCGQPFTDRILLDGVVAEEEVTENSASVDLTDRIREDILLALPGYPHCDEANLETRECPAAGRFQPETSYSPVHQDEAGANTRPDVWGALDNLTLPKPKPQKKQPKQP